MYACSMRVKKRPITLSSIKSSYVSFRIVIRDACNNAGMKNTSTSSGDKVLTTCAWSRALTTSPHLFFRVKRRLVKDCNRQTSDFYSCTQ
jgi:hypothetical protein